MRAALRSQVEHEGKVKQEAKEALVRDYSKEPHLVYSGDDYAAKGGAKASKSTRHASTRHVFLHARRLLDAQATQARAGELRQRLRRGRARA
eukprot:1111200-Pleurochrysis_carterae.AAC.2